jgi:uncharacterized membrane-anchored protein YhcB (DUF1043 family)
MDKESRQAVEKLRQQMQTSITNMQIMMHMELDRIREEMIKHSEHQDELIQQIIHDLEQLVLIMGRDMQSTMDS